MEARYHGGQVSWRPGIMEARYHGGQVSWRPGIMEVRYHGGQVSWRPGIMETRYHGGRRPSGDDSFHSPTVFPPSALDKPSIMKRYYRRWSCSHTSPRRSPTMVTHHDTQFVECRWWSDVWTVKTRHLTAVGLHDTGPRSMVKCFNITYTCLMFHPSVSGKRTTSQLWQRAKALGGGNAGQPKAKGEKSGQKDTGGGHLSPPQELYENPDETEAGGGNLGW